MTGDDRLLASAFRKILEVPRYTYIHIEVPGDDDEGHITIDDSYTTRDGLTGDELAAILRVVMQANKTQDNVGLDTR